MEEVSQIEVSFLLTSDEDYTDFITEKLNGTELFSNT